MIAKDIFEDLFVLEMSINHRGSFDRALDMVKEHSQIVRFNNVRCAIKLQFRDVDTFVHKDFRDRMDIRYIARVMDRRLSWEQYGEIVNYIRRCGCIPMSTPFDEESVGWCQTFNLPIIKIASSDCNDWCLIEAIAKTRKPVIVSVGGASQKDLDDLVTFFENRDIPLAINHCISAYPHEDYECELNQIDFLKQRYPGHTIGYSCHEYNDNETSIMLAYAKGARTFERHIDIDSDGTAIEKYCLTPEGVDQWFKAWKKAKLFCGAEMNDKVMPLPREIQYLDKLIRGVYLKRDLKPGDELTEDDIYMAIPLQRGQLSTREMMFGSFKYKITQVVKKDEPLLIDSIDSAYSNNTALKKQIYARGLEVEKKSLKKPTKELPNENGKESSPEKDPVRVNS